METARLRRNPEIRGVVKVSNTTGWIDTSASATTEPAKPSSYSVMSRECPFNARG
jgi:hypothetical protein